MARVQGQPCQGEGDAFVLAHCVDSEGRKRPEFLMFWAGGAGSPGVSGIAPAGVVVENRILPAQRRGLVRVDLALGRTWPLFSPEAAEQMKKTHVAASPQSPESTWDLSWGAEGAELSRRSPVLRALLCTLCLLSRTLQPMSPSRAPCSMELSSHCSQRCPQMPSRFRTAACPRTSAVLSLGRKETQLEASGFPPGGAVLESRIQSAHVGSQAL